MTAAVFLHQQSPAGISVLTLHSGDTPWPRGSTGSPVLPALGHFPAPCWFPLVLPTWSSHLFIKLLNLRMRLFLAGSLTDRVIVPLFQMMALSPRETKSSQVVVRLGLKPGPQATWSLSRTIHCPANTVDEITKR